MKRHMIWFLKYLVATTLTVAVSAAIVHAAYAGSRNVNRGWSGRDGSHSVSKSESWGNGAWNRDVDPHRPERQQRGAQHATHLPGRARARPITTPRRCRPARRSCARAASRRPATAA